MKTYTPPTLKPYYDWHNPADANGVQCSAEHPDYQPTTRQLHVIVETRKALERLESDGRYPYNCDVNAIVAAAFGVDTTDAVINPSKDYNVEQGIMGSDIYYARKYIWKQNLLAENGALIKANNLRDGLKIGKIRINCKTAAGCTITNITRNGAALAFTLGSKKYTAHMSSIKALIQSTNESGNKIFSTPTV